MLRIPVFINGSCSNGHWVKVNTISWRNIIHDISTLVDTEVSRMFAHDGTEISCPEQLTNGQVIFVSDGEDFIHLDNYEPGGTIDTLPVRKCPELPDEIIEMILKPLSTKDLLNVRLTTSRYLPIATGLCRSRNVRLRTSWFKEPHGMGIYRLYINSLPPWSSCTLDDQTFGSDLIWMRESFLEELGQYVLHAQITLDYRMITTIELMPNLTSVELINEIIHKKNRNKNNYIGVQQLLAETVQLPKLKRLKLELNHQNIHVLESLLRVAAQLNYLDISVSTPRLKEFGHLLVKIPSLTLKLFLPSMSDLKGLSKYQLMVHKLDLDVQESQIVETQTYILGLSHCLCSLRLGVNIKRGGSAMGAFNPSLPVLKTLKIDFLCNSSATSDAIKNYLESFFSVLDPAQMPLLQEFSISANGLHRKAWLFKSREILFESVTKLEVDNLTYLEDDWIQHFPNVREMTVQGRSQSFRKIFSTMTPLEHLVLKMRRPRADDLNINNVFAGMLHPEAAYDQIQQYEAGKQKLTPEVQTALDFRAPILNLTRLKKLELEITCWVDEENPKSRLQDCGIYFSLLQIQSLDFLGLCNDSISLEMEEKLRERHKKFVCERTLSLTEKEFHCTCLHCTSSDESWD